MNDFYRDNDWQRRKRDDVLAPGFYGRYSLQGRYVFLDKGPLSTILQKRYAVDTVVQGRKGDAICIEEKIVRWKGKVYKAFCLETDSCTVPGHESQGWMHYGQADFLLYCFEQEDGSLVCYLIDFPKLRDWFWENAELFRNFIMEERNRSKGKLAPIETVRAAVPTWRIHVPVPVRSEAAA